MKITQEHLRKIISEEISKMSENSDPRKTDDPERILADIGRRSENLTQKVREARKNVEDPDLKELLRDIGSELNMYVQTTYKFRHDYKPDY